MDIKFKNIVLLTGAGFTANFGGLLAQDIWYKIFNNPKIALAPELKELLRYNFNFEDVYGIVMNSNNYSVSQKLLLQSIVKEVYIDMDKEIQNYKSNSSDRFGVNWSGIGKFFSKLSGISGEVGVHFTLNQDLLLERRNHSHGLALETIRYKHYLEKIYGGGISADTVVQLPPQDFIVEYEAKHIKSAGNSFYIKLHGSCDWISSNGSNMMVIGTDKERDIDQEPLLKWYFNIFKEVLFREDVKLIVIGYSFSDLHINKVLKEAIIVHGLKIYNITKEKPADFQARVSDSVIYKAIDNYFPCMLKDIFPIGQYEPTTIERDIMKVFQ